MTGLMCNITENNKTVTPGLCVNGHGKDLNGSLEGECLLYFKVDALKLYKKQKNKKITVQHD